MSAPQLGRRSALGLFAAAAWPAKASTVTPLRVVIPALHPSSQEHAAYFPRLLRLALDKTVASDGPFELQSFNEEMSSPRQVAELRRQGVINVMWDGTNRQRETELLPIRISLLRQLNDYRVFLSLIHI